jgi:3-hydroxyisobutyrate dehydrogenase-like beta-hydroxyacid dehydrogenase
MALPEPRTAGRLLETLTRAAPDREAVVVTICGSPREVAERVPVVLLSLPLNYGFLTQLMLKDVKLFDELAEELRVPALVSPAVINAWWVAVAQGYGNRAFPTIAQTFERWAGAAIRARGQQG